MACLPACVCVAQSNEEPPPIHWAYAAFFGTGRYKLNDSSDVEVLRASIRHKFSDPVLEDGKRKPGISIRVPLTAGRQQSTTEQRADDIGEIVSSVSTLSLVPGIEFPILIGERWSIKPLASVGYGRALRGDESAWIYRAGIRSQYAFQTQRFDWELTSALLIYGFRDNTGLAEHVVPLTLGIDAAIPLANKKINDTSVSLHWHVMHTYYLEEPILRGELAQPVLALDGEWEFGAAFSRSEQRLRMWKFSWDRVGFGIRTNTEGQFTGFRLNFRSLFDL